MFIDKTLTAESELEAVEKVQSIFPESYVHCFGETPNGYDVAVYDSEEDYDADAKDGDNYRIKHRYLVKIGDVSNSDMTYKEVFSEMRNLVGDSIDESKIL